MRARPSIREARTRGARTTPRRTGARIAALVVACLAGALSPPAVSAEPRTEEQAQHDLALPNYARGGYFIGITGLWAAELEGQLSALDGSDMVMSGGFHLRLGARHNRWFATDIMGRYIHNFDVAGVELLAWGVQANERFYFSKSRWQPFVSVGMGFSQLSPTSGRGTFDPSFIAVLGGGLEIYANESVAFILEGNWNISVGGAADADGNQFLTAGLGVQFF